MPPTYFVAVALQGRVRESEGLVPPEHQAGERDLQTHKQTVRLGDGGGFTRCRAAALHEREL